MQVISFLNNKGGVGKTTLCCNMGQALAISGKKVLLIDNDNQHSLSNRLNVKADEVSIRSLYRDFSETEEFMPFLEKGVFPTALPRLHCLPSCFKLINSDVKSLKTLKDLIHKTEIAEYYDFVLIDNHPGLDMLQQSSILASTRFFVPVMMRQQCYEGLPEFMNFLHRLTIHDDAISIIPNHFEDLKSEKAILNSLRKKYPRNLTQTYVPKDRMIEEVERQGKILFLDRLLSSRAVPFLIKLITELFPEEYQESALNQTMSEKRSKHIGRRVLGNLKSKSELNAEQKTEREVEGGVIEEPTLAGTSVEEISEADGT